jgi:protein tyrosine kinase modulator
MNNIISRIVIEVLGARRFKWHGMVIAWLVCVTGWIGVALLPNNYESKAVLHVDTASVLRPLLADLAVNTNVMSEVRMMSEILRSRPQLERILRDTDLDLRADTPAELDDLLTSVRDRIRVSGGSPRNSYSERNIYTIKFVDRDPKMVHAVVQSLLDSFVETSLGQNKADSAGAQKFIEGQIAQYEQRLSEAEQDLAQFKRENVGLMPSEGQDYYQRLQSAMEELDRLRAEEVTILSRRRELQRQIDGEEPTFGLLTAPDTRPSLSTGSGLEVYEQELATLLLKYTDKHPKVVELRNRIDQMRRRQVQSAAASQSGPEIGTELTSMNILDRNPVYQSLKIAIGQSAAELSEVREQISSTRSRVENLRKMVDAVPEIEAKLARLNRDYEVNKAQYTALLRRLESARLSEQADSQTEDVKFRVIEPPVIPLKPTGPNRDLFATIVLLFGFGIGGGFAFLLNLLNPVFNGPDDVRQTLQLPVLGSIPAFQSEAQKAASKQRHHRFAYAAGGLVVMYIFALMFWPAADYVREIIQGGLA